MPDDPSRTLVFHPSARSVVYFGAFRFDLADGLLSRDGDEIALPPRAVVILQHLVERAGRVVSKQALMDAAWKDANVSETSLTEAIGLVRQALGDDPQHPTYVQTVHRRGYRFIAPIATDAPATVGAPQNRPRIEQSPGPAAARQEGAVVAAAPAPRAWPRTGIALVAGALLVSVAIALAWIGWRSSPSPPVVRVSLALAAEQAPSPDLTAHPVITISPDGKRIVYVGGPPGASRLLLRHMDRFEATPLPGTEGAHGPFFSPDGEWVAFFAGGSLRKIRADDSGTIAPQVLCATPTGVGGAWLSADEIVFAPDWTGPLMRVSASGGKPSLAMPSQKGRTYRWPDRLDDRTILATRWQTGPDDAAVVAVSLATGAEQVVAQPATFGRFMPGGYVVFLQGGDGYAVPIDMASHRPRGAPARVLPAVLTGMTGAAQLAISPDGSLIYIGDVPDRANRILSRADARGATAALPIAAQPFRNFAVCGDRLAATVYERGQTDLWAGRLDRAALTRVTRTGSVFEPIWSLDCRTITFAWNRAGASNMYSVEVDSGAEPRRLFESPLPQTPGAWSADGRWLGYVETSPDTAGDVWLWDRTTGSRRPLVAAPGQQLLARLSPDGTRVAYETSVPGGFEIEVASVATGARVQVSTGGGTWPAWSADGGQLFYLHDRTIMRVAFARGQALPADPVPVFEHPELVLFRPAGEQFVWLRRTAEATPLTRMDVVLNWLTELNREFR